MQLSVLQAKPNGAHYLLAKLSNPSELRKLAPNAASFYVITQNVDGLSSRALQELSAETSSLPDSDFGSSVIETHGRLLEVRCTSPICTWSKLNATLPLCPVLAEPTSNPSPDELKQGSDGTTEEQLPRCDACGSLARPGVVWLDEKPRDVEKIETLIKQADFCISVETSSTVGFSVIQIYFDRWLMNNDNRFSQLQDTCIRLGGTGERLSSSTWRPINREIALRISCSWDHEKRGWKMCLGCGCRRCAKSHLYCVSLDKLLSQFTYLHNTY